jgi:hypothetical protein
MIDMTINEMIESIGIEVECGIHNRSIASLSRKYGDNFRAEGDGSVHVYHSDARCGSCTKPWNDSRELKYWSNDKDKFYKFIRDVFKAGASQNSSCGNHLHFIFKNQQKALSFLSFPENMRKFTLAYAKKYSDRQKYLSRLNSHYCNDRFTVKESLIQLDTKGHKPDARYHAVNLNSYNLYGTIEIRILPHAQNARELIESVKWVINTLTKLLSVRGYTGNFVRNAYLDNLKRNIRVTERHLDKVVYISKPESDKEIIIKRGVKHV